MFCKCLHQYNWQLHLWAPAVVAWQPELGRELLCSLVLAAIQPVGGHDSEATLTRDASPPRRVNITKDTKNKFCQAVLQ